MKAPKEKLEELKRRVENAFADAAYPQGVIAPHECEECRDVRKAFADKDWKTIEPAILEENFGNLPLLSPEAFHYFLPAYLIYSLEHFSYDSNEICEFTIYALTPSNKALKENLEYWRERFQNFTAEQMNCIYEFLDLVRSDEEFNVFFKDIEKGARNLKDFIDPNLRK